MKLTSSFTATMLLCILTSKAQVKADFNFPQGKLTAPCTIVFTNSSQKAESFTWDLGDGTTSTELNPSHTYKNSGNYTITLIAHKGKKSSTSKKMIQVTAPDKCLLEIETTLGTMIAELYSSTPQHRDNFVKLADEGYFNDLLFHRVIAGFMIQGGDPNSRGAKPNQSLGFGGPNYLIPAEFADSLIHLKGSICAARTNNPEKKSSGSQFYIVQGSPINEGYLQQIENMKGYRYTPEQRTAYATIGGTPQLDRDYTVFGRIIEGLDIIDKIAATPTGAGDRPVTDVKMKIRAIK